jgi:peptidyl-prolyl cis-trans isomerase C
MKMKASHILVADLNTAHMIKQKLNEGNNFDSLARKFSTCPSNARGGDLGEFGPGMMVKPFEDATVALQVGSVSDPVQTQFGWHIIHRTG